MDGMYTICSKDFELYVHLLLLLRNFKESSEVYDSFKGLFQIFHLYNRWKIDLQHAQSLYYIYKTFFYKK